MLSYRPIAEKSGQELCGKLSRTTTACRLVLQLFEGPCWSSASGTLSRTNSIDREEGSGAETEPLDQDQRHSRHVCCPGCSVVPAYCRPWKQWWSVTLVGVSRNPPPPRSHDHMTISKVLRYQILRRDNHACRYCGEVAPDVELTVDHVLAAALGGTDDPSNLVASCKDCNAGKAATSPDQALVDQVSEEAIRWAQAVRVAADKALERFEEIRAQREQFRSAWDAWTYNQGKTRYNFPLPSTWEGSIDSMLARGLPMELLLECVRITMSRPNVTVDKRFTYFCGVAWRKVNEIDEAAKRVFNGNDSDQEPHRPVDSMGGLILTLVDFYLFGLITQAMGGSERAYDLASMALWESIPDACEQLLEKLNAGATGDEAQRIVHDDLASRAAPYFILISQNGATDVESATAGDPS